MQKFIYPFVTVIYNVEFIVKQVFWNFFFLVYFKHQFSLLFCHLQIITRFFLLF